MTDYTRQLTQCYTAVSFSDRLEGLIKITFYQKKTWLPYKKVPALKPSAGTIMSENLIVRIRVSAQKGNQMTGCFLADNLTHCLI